MTSFSAFDTRRYQTLTVHEGYGEWAQQYESTVLDLLDLRLLARLETIAWSSKRRGADLACGTGRSGAWLKRTGVAALDGVDFTAEMLARAKAKRVYDRLILGDMTATTLDSGAYDLVTAVLADEHLPTLTPLYREAARLAAERGHFIVVGYHPHFLMLGIPVHFDRASGEHVAIESHVHLLSDHMRAARGAGLRLIEMDEGVVDEAWIAAKPKWAAYRHHPVSFALVWEKS
jgi:SAM-dependent methyltransferase